MTTLLRRIKRGLLYGGYARSIHYFLKDIERERSGSFHPTDGRYLVNLSFDLELALSSPFWRGEPAQTLEYGRRALANFEPILRFLNHEHIACNVQVVANLLSDKPDSLPFFDSAQTALIRNNEELFRLSPLQVNLLKEPNVEVGVHGLSHRHFTTLSREDADYEVREATVLFQGRFDRAPRVMSFPKNYVAHTDILKRYGIRFWRTGTQAVKEDGEIPVGLWFAPGVLGQSDLGKLLSKLRRSRNGFFLHLWGHFTEMNAVTFATLIGVIKENGWECSTVRDFKTRI